MKIKDFYNKGKTVLSFEVFPPKKTSGKETVYKAIDELKLLKPDYISVTYGAGGQPYRLPTARAFFCRNPFV